MTDTALNLSEKEEIARKATGAGSFPCECCGGPSFVWFAPNQDWNLVMGGPEAKGDPGGIVCPNCYIWRAEAAGISPTAWIVTREQLDSPTPSPSWRPDREAVARIVDPQAWAFHDRHLDTPGMKAEIAYETRESLRKADAILALSPPPSPATGGEEDMASRGPSSAPVRREGPTASRAADDPRRVNHCHAGTDGDCHHADCPQIRDNEPHATGRHCPLDVGCPRCCLPEDECEC